MLAAMDTDIARLRYVTSRYPQLQGLRLVPLSLVFLASAVWRAGLLPLPGDNQPLVPELWFFAALVTAVLVSFVLRLWYTSRIGSVGQYGSRSAALPLFATAVAAGAAVWLQVMLQWRISLPAVTVGMALLAVGAAHYEFRRHYVAAAVVLFAFAVFPLGAWGSKALSAALDGAIGLSMLIAAVGDHRLVVRTLRPPQEAHS
jgi:hypothetical protein